MMNNGNDQTVTLGMGCFWSPDALFGQLAGITRTRVGFAGGTTENPTYRQLGDHSETVEMDFDSSIVSLEAILHVFWSNHNPVNINDYKGRQYRSLVLYRDPSQLDIIRKVMANSEEQGKGTPDTEVAPFKGFYPAEDRHQKYYLKRYPDAIDKLSTLFPTEEALTNATLAARLNGLAKGYTNRDRIINEIRTWLISGKEQEEIIRLIRGIKW
ncbi:peptide-methionine (S)-S-oxide reductase [Paenibacillus sp. CGMCC 1.16610]|uniref:Peptide methionine sulfoxide reductase MsrA n=2 Tax=Paenibacillus anseongense TaxID=2682845 RepID=A0ABW9U7K3_9BACL|nr:peptide-methionine (S)-S-oxide reductase [Paenibacillus sp. CGMCC 1.16610]MBA2942602.1 peptide-methionine (S)-S-oxide reductase [Paenibacillus sp. CGMCC 1.16610]MVQ35416.1 peptide methionine sulfoxide reductase [Paenibacillus anseongense]